MIFCTTGTQIPFDRFVELIDEIAPQIEEEIVVQAFRHKYEPKHIKMIDFVDPNEFDGLFNSARVIVSHAGMGTILSAMEKDIPIIIIPRLASLGEHRNDHQLFTTKKMEELGYVYAARNADELLFLLKNQKLKALHHIGNIASLSLIKELCEKIG